MISPKHKIRALVVYYLMRVLIVIRDRREATHTTYRRWLFRLNLSGILVIVSCIVAWLMWPDHVYLPAAPGTPIADALIAPLATPLTAVNIFDVLAPMVAWLSAFTVSVGLPILALYVAMCCTFSLPLDGIPQAAFALFMLSAAPNIMWILTKGY